MAETHWPLTQPYPSFSSFLPLWHAHHTHHLNIVARNLYALSFSQQGFHYMILHASASIHVNPQPAVAWFDQARHFTLPDRAVGGYVDLFVQW